MGKRILVYGMTNLKGGIESYIMNIYRNLDYNKVIFDFICDFPEMAYYEEVIKNGSKVYFIPSKRKKIFSHLWKFFKILKNHKEYGVVYFNILNASAAVSMISVKLLGRKIISHSHNSSDINMKIHNKFKWLLNKLSDKKLACSYEAGKYMYLNDKEYTVINNAIDIEKFSYSEKMRENLRKKLKIQEKKVLLHVARMDRVKNPLFLIEILKKLVSKNKEYILFYIGKGNLEEEIKERVRAYKLEQYIFFLGQVDNVNDYMQIADIFVLPSLFEGMPIVLIEAQACKLPIVVSNNITKDIRLIEEVIYLSLKEDIATWANEIDKLVLSTNRDSINISRIKEEYDIKKIVLTIQKILCGENK
ncbi:glycosyltransferase [Fusobacterium simiae]|uniref:glycosyltransferase n=1 Tax=Fusobacterium TaxID=848 RepID=UPI0003FF2480|nr:MULTISPECIES: glycosyltransferase [Fusobacterium]MDC7955797.1 glycosyltransferase [Fusobacterium simiae]